MYKRDCSRSPSAAMAVIGYLHMTMFLFLFFGYLALVYIRQSVSFAAPVIAESEHLENSHLGLIVSSQQLGYTLIKFLGGALVDVIDPGLTFVASLLLTSLTCVAFTAVTTVPYFVIFWFLCGMAQGPAWSACALLLKQNFPADQFATWWSVLSTSSNVAGTVGPFISQAVVSSYSWRTSLLVGATSCLGLSCGCFVFFRNFNSSHQRDMKNLKAKNLNLMALLNPLLMLICLQYLIVSLIRGACTDWGQMYLIKSKGQSLLAGSSFISSLEVGGVVGSILAGYLSDILVSQDENRAKPRLRIITALTVIQTLGLYMFIFYTHTNTSQVWTNLFSFTIGFGMYGIISLLGVASMETAPQNLSGTAHSLATLGGNIGRVIAGYPLSVIATWLSWHESFLAVLMISLLCVGVSLLCVKLLPAKDVTDIEYKRNV